MYHNKHFNRGKFMKISTFRIRTRLVNVFFILLVTLPVSYHCIKVPSSPVIPQWETQLNLTLVNKTYYFNDLVNKDPKFDTTTGIVLYRPTENAIGSRQGIPKSTFNMPSPKGNTIQQEVGVVPVDIGVPPTFALTASDLGINSANLNPTFNPQTATLSPSQLGIPTGVPLLAEIPAIPVDQNFGDTTKFTYIVFSNGTISLKITNNFPFGIQFASNQLRLLNFNKAADTTSVVATFTFAGTIAAGSSATSAPVSLSGKTMDGILKLKGTMSTTGALNKTLTASNNLSAEVTIANAQIQSMVPDPAPPTAINETFGDSTDFKYIVFETGQMSLTINNSFPFNIQFAGNSLLLVNKNDTTQIVGTFVFPGVIAANTSATSNIVQLASKRMDAILKLKGTVNISNYFGKTISGTDKLVSTLNMTNGYLQTALVNTINFNPTSVVAVPDSAVKLDEKIKVKLARFESGGMKIRIINKAALKLSVKFGISELSDNLKGGQEYKLPGTNIQTGIVEIMPKESLVTTIGMKDVSFVSRDRSGGDTVVTQYLHFSLEIKTLKASTGYVTVNKNDLVIADVQPEGSFVLSEVQGKIPPDTLQINHPYKVGIGDIGNNLTLKGLESEIKLTTKIFSTGLFPTDVLLKIYPVDKIGREGSPIYIIKRINPGDPADIIIPKDSVNKLIKSFLPGELPSSFIIRGNVIVSPLDVYSDNTNPKAGVGRVVQNDSVFVDLDYAIPVAIGINEGVLKNPPTAFSQTVDTTQVNLIKNGKIYLDFKNTFPLDVEMKLKLLKGYTLRDTLRADTISAPVLTVPQVPTDTLNYPPLRVAADTTAARTGQRSFTFLNLTPEDAKKLSSASFSAVELRMNTGGNGSAAKQFNLTDKLVMSVKANIIFLVSEDRLK